MIPSFERATPHSMVRVAEAAAAIGVTPNAFRSWERDGKLRLNRLTGKGKVMVTVSELARIADYEIGVMVRLLNERRALAAAAARTAPGAPGPSGANTPPG